ncbi:hypothetical protein NHX12_019617 [Muraenolepis orangiensis]|uniref:Uncharacterized protein n=1 Tax=Muraenolepis orangiensis TaxID=630683 RepID=A0A9Q0EYW7_9TELE|nr:hypothetical protein NHX12_019617 [Muraenolepis orangiensis]
MLGGGREGLFELGQQLQQQGEDQAALHCFLSCLLGLSNVHSFTSLPNCLHQWEQWEWGVRGVRGRQLLGHQVKVNLLFQGKDPWRTPVEDLG